MPVKENRRRTSQEGRQGFFRLTPRKDARSTRASFREETMIINHNMSAMFADRQLKINGMALDKSIEKLSSGSRITRAGDDASGLAVSEKMRSQIRGLRQASTNASNGISFIQTTEGYLQESQDIIQRLRELAVQSANGIYTDEDRMQIQVEVSALVNEVDRIASHAQFNGMNMLTGRFARPAGQNVITGSMWLQIGANMDQRVRVFIGTMTAAALGIRQFGTGQFISMSTPDGANRAIGQLDAALKLVNKQRADLGAYQNRLEYAVKGLDVGAENMQAAESRIRDLDMASEMVEYTKNAIITQAATAMLAQANAKPRTVLQLLQ
jgi:flagellin